jgi:hypothetical protein
MVIKLLKRFNNLVNPKFVRMRRIRTNTTDLFADSMFRNRQEFDELIQEFWDTDVVNIIKAASTELDGDARLFDANQEICARYYSLVRKYKPEILVETGVYSDISTLCLLIALQKNNYGKLYSIDNSSRSTTLGLNTDQEIDPYSPQHWLNYATNSDVNSLMGPGSCCSPGSHMLPPDKSPGWIIPQYLKSRWELLPGEIHNNLSILAEDLGKIDFFVHDSTPEINNMRFEFDIAWNHLSEGGLILSHHTGWNEFFKTFFENKNAETGIVYWRYENTMANYAYKTNTFDDRAQN